MIRTLNDKEQRDRTKRDSDFEELRKTLETMLGRLEWLEKEVHGIKGEIHEAKSRGNIYEKGLTWGGKK